MNAQEAVSSDAGTVRPSFGEAQHPDGGWPEGASKNHANIIWPRTLNLPLFLAEGLESRNITYKVEAAILHRGQSITEGHYTTLLHAEGDSLFCDDGVEPRPVSLHSTFRAGPCFQSREVYLLICRRGEAPRC